jgi:DNA-binding CsgD family transcriptional regulator
VRFDLRGHVVRVRAVIPQDAAVQPLSAREREVVGLALGGRANKVIAFELGLAYSTVRVLMARAAAKIGVRTRAELLEKVVCSVVGP